MTLNLQKAMFSIAYTHAVAAVSGVNVGKWEVDDDSVDISLRRKGGCAPTLDLQLKCTADPLPTGNSISFSLSMKNYDDLRRPVQGARWLVVMFVPAQATNWLRIEEPEQIIMRRCAWWLRLDGHEPVDGQDSVTVYLPKANLFDPAALVAKMDEMETLFRANLPPAPR